MSRREGALSTLTPPDGSTPILKHQESRSAMTIPNPHDYIVIVTGWRGARQDRHTNLIAEELTWIRDYRNVILRHGRCPYGGVDLIADGIARGWGWTVEEFPPQIVGGRILGSTRNRDMCAAQPTANEVVAFPGPGSRGTWDCLRWAARYGIPFRGRALEGTKP